MLKYQASYEPLLMLNQLFAIIRLTGTITVKVGIMLLGLEVFVKKEWMRISDDHAKLYSNLIKDLKDVKVLMLEKKNRK